MAEIEMEMEPMLSGGSRSARGCWAFLALPLAGLALATRYGVPRFFFPEALLEEYYTAGYKEGVNYRICNLEVKQCLAADAKDSAALELRELAESSNFLIGGARTSLILGQAAKGLCVEAEESSLQLGRCKKQTFEVPMVRTMGQIKSEGQPELCLQATKGHPVQMGPCGAMGTSWIVGEMAPSYLEGARYKICNTQLEKCIGDCPSGEKACASAGSGAFLVDEAAAPHFVIKTVRTNLDVTTLALEADRDLCLQVQGFGTCDGACALQGSSPLKFEKCQETRQNFHLPFPPESYGRLRWALYEDRCIEALQSKVQVSPCDARKLVFWRLVPA